MITRRFSSEISFSFFVIFHYAKGVSVDQQTLSDLEADQRNIPGGEKKTRTSPEGPIQSLVTL